MASDAKNSVDVIKQLVTDTTDQIKFIKGTVTGYTGGTGIQIKFAGDAAAPSTNYNVVLPYGSLKPSVGDEVLVAQIPQDDGSVSFVVAGAIGPPPAPTAQAMPTGAVLEFAGS